MLELGLMSFLALTPTGTDSYRISTNPNSKLQTPNFTLLTPNS